MFWYYCMVVIIVDCGIYVSCSDIIICRHNCSLSNLCLMLWYYCMVVIIVDCGIYVSCCDIIICRHNCSLWNVCLILWHYCTLVVTRWFVVAAWQQHDVQELCRVMFDALERSWKNTDQANLITQLYQGQIKDYVKCLQVQHFLTSCLLDFDICYHISVS